MTRMFCGSDDTCHSARAGAGKPQVYVPGPRGRNEGGSVKSEGSVRLCLRAKRRTCRCHTRRHGGTEPSRVSLEKSDRHDLLFLLLHQLVDPADVAVGELLDVRERTALLVLRDRPVLEQLLELVVRVAANVAHRGAMLLRD